MEMPLILLLLTLLIALSSAFLWFSVGHATKFERITRPSYRVFTVDILALTLFQALPALGLTFVRSREREIPTILLVLAAFLSLALLSLWWKSATTLSRAGVVASGRRLIFLAFVIPSSLSIAMVLIPFLLVYSFRLPEGWNDCVCGDEKVWSDLATWVRNYFAE